MFDQRPRRALLLVLLGMATFFFVSALLTLAIWLTVGNWRQLVMEVALVAILISMPVAGYLWANYFVHRL